MPGVARDDPDRWALDLLGAVLGDGMSSRLFLELRERRSLSYDVSTFGAIVRRCGTFGVHAGFDPGGRRRVVAAILEQLERICTEPVAAAELDRARAYTRGRLELRMEDTGAVAGWLGTGEALLPRILTVDEVIERLEAVTADDLLRVARRVPRAGPRPPGRPRAVPLPPPVRAGAAPVSAAAGRGDAGPRPRSRSRAEPIADELTVEDARSSTWCPTSSRWLGPARRRAAGAGRGDAAAPDRRTARPRAPALRGARRAARRCWPRRSGGRAGLVGARAALDAIRRRAARSGGGRSCMLIEAEAVAAAGEPDRAAGALERVVDAIGVDEAWKLRGGVPGRLAWPLPAELVPAAAPGRAAAVGRQPPPTPTPEPADGDARTAAARGRLEAARVAYVAGDSAAATRELSLAVRLDPRSAGDGVAILEPTLGGQPAAGASATLRRPAPRRRARASRRNDAYDRAADRRS